MATESQSATRAVGGKSVRVTLGKLMGGLTLEFRASGRKSSEGDGRTAADIRRELAAQSAERS